MERNVDFEANFVHCAVKLVTGLHKTMIWMCETHSRVGPEVRWIHNPVDSRSWCYIGTRTNAQNTHHDVIKWNHFPRYRPFVRGIHRSPVNSPHKGQWRGAVMFSLICARINAWVNNQEAGDLRRYRTHYDVIVMNRLVPRINKILTLHNLKSISSPLSDSL